MIGLRQLRDLSRADFLTSVGLYFSNDRLCMVRLRKTLFTLSMLEQEQRELPERDNRDGIAELTGWVTEDVRDIALKGEDGTREHVLKQALLSFLPHINAARDQVFICIPQEQTIVQQVILPLAAQDNVRQVVEYELERQLPFKREEIYYDYLPTGKKGEKLSVYVFAIAKKHLDGLLALLESVGIKPSGVETTATALANYLLFTEESSPAGAALVTGHPTHWELIGVATRPNGWKPTPELLFSHRFPAAEWAHGAGHEALEECLRAVPKLFRSGDLSVLNGLAVDRLEAAEEMAAVGRRHLPWLKTETAQDTIPAIGAALRGVREASLRGNLLHEGANEADGRKGLSLLNWALAAVLLIGLIGWGTSFPIKDELRLRQLQRENQKLAPAVEALRREDEQLERLRKEQSFLSEVEQRRGEVLRVLDELSKIIPNTAYLSNLRYRSGILEVQGSAENASALIPLLERSAVFENVNFNAPSNRGRDNRETFSLKADLEKSKVTARDLKGVGGPSVPPAKSEKAKP